MPGVGPVLMRLDVMRWPIIASSTWFTSRPSFGSLRSKLSRTRFSSRKCSGESSPWNQNSSSGVPSASGASVSVVSCVGRTRFTQPSHSMDQAPRCDGYSGEAPSPP